MLSVLDRFVLPAYAGMIRTISRTARRRKGAPRVCGDDPARVADEVMESTCSPRMRG